MKIWLERDTGHAFYPDDRQRESIRRFPGYQHEFQDITDRPCPTIKSNDHGPPALIIEHTSETRATKQNKPPYSVPTMAAIASTPRNGYKVVSLFSGCGGSGLGYRMAGFDVVYANEFIEAARESYLANYPDAIVDPRDIRVIEPDDILKATGLAVGELDLLDGSPPCASFSMAGKREAGWNKVKTYSETKQRTDDLFFEYVRILKGLKPRTFVAENVSGLVKGVAKGYFKEILAALESAGYRVGARVLDAQWLGVPQARQRLIFVGVRTDLDQAPVHPLPLQYRYSVAEALPWIRRVEIAGPNFKPGWQTGARPSPTIVQSGNASFKQSPYTLVEAERVPVGLKLYDKTVSLNEPAPTVLTHGRQATRNELSIVESARAAPTEKRRFSIAELKRICAFPDDFILTGTYAQQWERLGRAVPPVMMSHIAATVRDEILRKIDGNPGRLDVQESARCAVV